MLSIPQFNTDFQNYLNSRNIAVEPNTDGYLRAQKAFLANYSPEDVQNLYDYASSRTDPSKYGGEAEVNGTLAKAIGQLAAENSKPTVPGADQAELNTKLADQNQKTAQTLTDQLNQIYDQVSQTATQNLDAQFIPQRQNLIQEEAALGRLSSPTSITNLSKLDNQQNLSRGQLLGQIAGAKASGTTNIAQTIANLTQAQQGLTQQNSQFNQDLGLRTQALNNQQSQFDQQFQQQKENLNQGLSLSKYLGQLQADAQKPGTLDYLKTAFSGLEGLGGAAGGVGSLITALG